MKIGVSTSPCGRVRVPARAEPSVAWRVKGILLSDLLHVASLERDRQAVHPAVDLMVALHQTDGFGFRAGLQSLGCSF